MQDTDRAFIGSIPALYEQYLGPLIFDSYAADLAQRLTDLQSGRLLETAAGTGIVTRVMRASLADDVEIVSTDLNPAMLDFAQTRPTSGIEWQQADACLLPFDDASYDAIVCQFGVMFFPDKAKGYAEARRVLRPGGRLLFNVWDGLQANDFARLVHQSVAARFPNDPPGFLARVPYGYHDSQTIEAALRQAGFRTVTVEAVEQRSRASSPSEPALGFCQGTPLRNEIEARDPTGLEGATEAAASALADSFGPGPVEGRIRAYVVEARP